MCDVTLNVPFKVTSRNNFEKKLSCNIKFPSHPLTQPRDTEPPKTTEIIFYSRSALSYLKHLKEEGLRTHTAACHQFCGALILSIFIQKDFIIC